MTRTQGQIRRKGVRSAEKKSRDQAFALLKYGFALLVTLLAAFTTSNGRILAMGVVELCLIFCLTNAFIRRAPVLGRVARFLLLFVYDAQMLVLYFANSYITLLMLANLVLLQDLSGNFSLYLLLIAPMLVILLLPVPAFFPKRRWGAIALVAFALWLGALPLLGPDASPLVSAGRLAKDAIDFRRLRTGIGDQGNGDVMRYFKAGVEDCRPKAEALPEKPNIILVFVEGLSQNIVEDARGVTPNLAALEGRTVCFKRYYNHTFATLRGLIGQLYSGFQLSDRDANQLISLQSVLHDLGYHTSFINTEPNNVHFVDYLEAMGFDELISNRDWVTPAYVTLDYVSDRDAFDRLLEAALSRHASGQPFFTAMYTFGTHASFDSPDAVFGDGSNPELNKFYNLDVQLGRFMERFDESELAEDTLVVITTDHATYMDRAFTDSFPDYSRWHTEMDRIPLMFYHRGVTPEVVDAGRRNSIDLAPTILDYVDLSAPNTFLGESLFKKEPMKHEILPYDRCFFDGTEVVKTGVKKENDISKKKKKAMLEVLMDYFAVSVPSDQGLRAYDVDIRFSEDGRSLYVQSGYPVEPGRTLWFVMWGSQGGTDDLKGYRGQLEEDGLWHCEISLAEHGETGMNYLVARIGDAEEMPEGGTVVTKWFYIKEIPE